MLKEIKQKISLSPELEKKIKWASNYSTVKVNVLNGTLIKLIPTNIAYVEPHKVIINNLTFLFFNGKQYFYINDFDTKYKLSELELYFRKASSI